VRFSASQSDRRHGTAGPPNAGFSRAVASLRFDFGKEQLLESSAPPTLDFEV
jgi:hypothetical protein